MNQATCLILLILALLWGTTSHAATRTPQSATNVLLILSDDLNDWIGCLGGHPQAHTPNLDRLAARGTLFSNAHVQGPLCNPSRTSFLTGLRPSTTGIYGLAPGHRSAPRTRDAVTLNQYFRNQGYFTATFGKVYHDGSFPVAQRTNEFDVWGPAPGALLPKTKFIETPEPHRLVDWAVFPSDDRDADQADWKIATAAIEQLRTLPTNKPFFVSVGFRLPHVPCFASQKWFDLIPEPVTLPPYLPGDRDDIPPTAWFLHWKLPEPRLSWLRETNQWEALTRAYLATIAFMDAQVGRLLSALETQGLAKNTIVVFCSDNGWHIGEKDITGKNTLWEPSTRVPLIFAGPGVKSGVICEQPAELLDIYPTLVDLCKFPRKSGLEGHSLAPQLKNPRTRRQWPAITTHGVGNHAIRSLDWRYIRYADGSQELYNLRHDPHEWTNRVSEPRLASLVSEHAKFLPKTDAPPVEGSKGRVLTRTNGVWYWEGQQIKPEELER